MTAFNRNTGIGGTDARMIMAGDWHQLWCEKTGRSPPPYLDDIFRVQLGKLTEEFHLNWVGKRQQIKAEFLDKQRFDTKNPWRYVTLDGWDLTNSVPIEVKHSNSNATIRDRADYYMAQLQHNLAVTGKDWLWFSVIPGNEEPMTVKVDRDQEYIDQLTDLERSFWWHVTEDVAPDILPSAKLEKAAARVDDILVGGYTTPKDMTKHNLWAELAAEYLEIKPKADRCAVINKEIKELVHPTWGGAYGHGLIVSRTKKGLTLRIDGKDE